MTSRSSVCVQRSHYLPCSCNLFILAHFKPYQRLRLQHFKPRSTAVPLTANTTNSPPNPHLPSQRPHPLLLLNPLRPLQPTNAVLRKNLHARLQRRLVQIKVIDRADSRDQHAREPRRNPVHQRAADRAEVVLHRVAAGDRLALRELRELVAAAHVLRRGVLDDEVGGEHRGGDLAAVGAVADEGVHVARLFEGLGRCWVSAGVIGREGTSGWSYEEDLHAAAEAGCGCGVAVSASFDALGGEWEAFSRHGGCLFGTQNING